MKSEFTINNSASYWKQRCRLAENCISGMIGTQLTQSQLERFKKWQGFVKEKEEKTVWNNEG